MSAVYDIELDDYHDDDQDDCHDDSEAEERHCCSSCMDCLGLSWRDFM